MEIPRSLLNSLTEEVNALSGAAQRQAGSALARVFAEWDGGDVAALREACIEVLQSVCGTYSDLSAARAAEFYDEVRVLQEVRGTYRPVADSRRDPAKTAESVHALVQSVVDTGDTDVFGRALLSRVDLEVRRSANDCVAYNVRRDPKKPRYARVPTGGETCGFCLMLASFGFNWTSPETASHAHASCDCRVVPSFGRGSVEGYDPDGMYDRFNDCLSALGGRDGLRAEWQALPEDERGDFQKYVNKRVSAEIELRDPKWFQTGEHSGLQFTDEAVRADKERRWREDQGERITARKLNDLGYKAEFWEDEIHLKEPNAKGQTTTSRADLSTGIELKTLYSASSENTFKSHMKSASKKSALRFPLFDISENGAVDEDEAIGWIRKYMGWYHVPEVRVLLRSGEIIRLTA